MPNKAFVTVGNSPYGFDRMMEIVCYALEKNLINKNSVIQIGGSNIVPEKGNVIRYFSAKDHDELINDAAFVVCHGGSGSIIKALRLGKKVIAIPRKYQLGEHVDDHQVEMCGVFEDKGYILVASNKENFKEKVLQIEDFCPNKFLSDTRLFASKINEYINKLR